MNLLHGSLFVALLVLPAAAQTTHLVGPGGLPQIRSALAIAAPGDIVNVLPGTYAHFEATVGVTIRAVTIGTVLIEYDPAFPPGCTSLPCDTTRIAPPVGQFVHCIGLDFRSTFGAAYTHQVLVASGTATFDRCSLRCSLFALVVDGARVHLQDCSLTNFGTGSSWGGLVATASVITAVRCSFTSSQQTLTPPGPGVRLRSSHFQGSKLQLTGGMFFLGPYPGAGYGLDLDATSSAWISDSTITGSGTCPVLVGGGTGRLDRCVLLPPGPGCTSLPGGLVVGADSVTPLQNGAPFTVDYRTSPNQLLLVYASPGLGYVPLPGITDQPLSIDPANFWLATVLLSDATGFATVTWNMPAGQFLDAPIYVMGVGLAPTSLALSPPVGGVIR